MSTWSPGKGSPRWTSAPKREARQNGVGDLCPQDRGHGHGPEEEVMTQNGIVE